MNGPFYRQILPSARRQGGHHPTIAAPRVAGTAAASSSSDVDAGESPFTNNRMNFVYMTAEEEAFLERQRLQDLETGLAEYGALKELMLKRTWRFGSLFSLYLLFQISGKVCVEEGCGGWGCA